ncbi:rnase h domain protein [Ophiostoma piceae UAMH 11346]|uniref:ribonuclease H n=1 Tax=Ophiostoma piceae (strain UAMH 11346) TaxID=1262450 RepID=S3BXV1_OPHP1|nr:rnase h domain protein [Ophiostoma piceae UAMH 11346]
MPRGWYLAQGLIPLGYSSSDDEEGPCELPNGRLVCGPHGLVSCHRCCSDYSFVDDVLSHAGDEDDEDDEDDSIVDSSDVPSHGPGDEDMHYDGGWDEEMRKGTGRDFPAKFVPPSASVTPLDLFSGRKAHMLVTRYTLQNDPGTALIHTDGACLNNGQPDPKAGWGFWHGLNPSGKRLVVTGRLEKKGPFGDDYAQSSNRAELRAVIAALGFRHWPGEGFRTLVIATDSEYVVEGSTKWAKTWVQNGWKTRAGPVKNKDLWVALLGQVEGFKEGGMVVKFWRIPRDWNTVADAAAKDAAAKEDAPNEWSRVFGVNI